MKNSSLELASEEQKKADENVLRLVEEQKVCCLILSFYYSYLILVKFMHCFTILLTKLMNIYALSEGKRRGLK